MSIETGLHLIERETPTQSIVQHCKAAVRRIHHADDIDIILCFFLQHQIAVLSDWALHSLLFVSCLRSVFVSLCIPALDYTSS